VATLLLKMKGRELQSMAITKTRTVIGRDSTCDLSIDNQSVSRQHARIDYDGAGFVITDQESANGIYINGKQVPSAPLINGCEIQIGKFTVTFLALGGVSPDRLTQAVEANVGQSVDVGETTLLDDDYKRKLLIALNRTRVGTDPAIRRDTKKSNLGLWVAVVVLGVLVLVLAGVALS